jgi:hypothetical protein
MCNSLILKVTGPPCDTYKRDTPRGHSRSSQQIQMEVFHSETWKR